MHSTYDWVLIVQLMSSIAPLFLLCNRALRQLPVCVASLMAIITIPLSCILSWLLLNEPLTSFLLLSGALVVLGGTDSSDKRVPSKKSCCIICGSYLVKTFLFQDRISVNPEFL